MFNLLKNATKAAADMERLIEGINVSFEIKNDEEIDFLKAYAKYKSITTVYSFLYWYSYAVRNKDKILNKL